MTTTDPVLPQLVTAFDLLGALERLLMSPVDDSKCDGDHRGGARNGNCGCDHADHDRATAYAHAVAARFHTEQRQREKLEAALGDFLPGPTPADTLHHEGRRYRVCRLTDVPVAPVGYHCTLCGLTIIPDGSAEKDEAAVSHVHPLSMLELLDG